MNHRVIAAGLSVLSALGALAGYLMAKHPVLVGLCEQGEALTRCLPDPLFHGIIRPLYWGIWPLPIFFAGLILIPKDIFFAWLRWFGPLGVGMAFLIASTSPYPDGWGIYSIVDRTLVTTALVRLYIFTSLVFIGADLAYRSRRQDTGF